MARTGQTVPGDRPEVDRLATRDDDEAYATGDSRAGTRASGDRTMSASLGATGYLIGIAGGALVIVLLVVALGAGGWAVTAVAVVVLLVALVVLGGVLVR